jgi:hypothetical protein
VLTAASRINLINLYNASAHTHPAQARLNLAVRLAALVPCHCHAPPATHAKQATKTL